MSWSRVAGLLQINARLPGGFATSGDVPIVLQVGTATRQSGFTISSTLTSAVP